MSNEVPNMATIGKAHTALTIQLMEEIQAVRMRVSRLRDELQHDFRSELKMFKKQLYRAYRAKQVVLERERLAKEQRKRQEEEERTNPSLTRATGTEDFEKPAAHLERPSQDEDANACRHGETMRLQLDEATPIEVRQQKESVPGPEETTCALQLVAATLLEADFSSQQTRRVSHEDGNVLDIPLEADFSSQQTRRVSNKDGKALDGGAVDGDTQQNEWTYNTTYNTHETTDDVQLSESPMQGDMMFEAATGDPLEIQKQGQNEEQKEWVEPQRNRGRRVLTPESSLVGGKQHSKQESPNSHQVVLEIEVAFRGLKRPMEEVIHGFEEHTYLHCLDALSATDTTLSDATGGKRRRHSLSPPTKKWRRMHRDRRLQSFYVDY